MSAPPALGQQPQHSSRRRCQSPSHPRCLPATPEPEAPRLPHQRTRPRHLTVFVQVSPPVITTLRLLDVGNRCTPSPRGPEPDPPSPHNPGRTRGYPPKRHPDQPRLTPRSSARHPARTTRTSSHRSSHPPQRTPCSGSQPATTSPHRQHSRRTRECHRSADPQEPHPNQTTMEVIRTQNLNLAWSPLDGDGHRDLGARLRTDQSQLRVATGELGRKDEADRRRP